MHQFIRLQNSRFFFFLKISKEIGNVCRYKESYGRVRQEKKIKVFLARLSPVSLSVFSLVPDLFSDCSRVLEYAKIRTVLQQSITPLTYILKKYNPVFLQLTYLQS